jgi:hypothetical protein
MLPAAQEAEPAPALEGASRKREQESPDANTIPITNNHTWVTRSLRHGSQAIAAQQLATNTTTISRTRTTAPSPTRTNLHTRQSRAPARFSSGTHLPAPRRCQRGVIDIPGVTTTATTRGDAQFERPPERDLDLAGGGPASFCERRQRSCDACVATLRRPGTARVRLLAQPTVSSPCGTVVPGGQRAGRSSLARALSSSKHRCTTASAPCLRAPCPLDTWLRQVTRAPSRTRAVPCDVVRAHQPPRRPVRRRPHTIRRAAPCDVVRTPTAAPPRAHVVRSSQSNATCRPPTPLRIKPDPTTTGPRARAQGRARDFQ